MKCKLLIFIWVVTHNMHTFGGISYEDYVIQHALSVPNIYCPERDCYSQSIEHDDKNKVVTQKAHECPFCLEIAAEDDEKYLILRRFKFHVVMLNLYPYTKGHLLIVPYEHMPKLSHFSQEARAELIELASHCTDIVQRVFECPGVNIGFNIGRIAGASIPDHLHMQIVPRRNIDVSFIQVIGKVKVTTYDLREIYALLKPHFDNL